MNKKTEILFFFEAIDKFSLDEKNYREWIKMILKSEGSFPGFLNVIFTNDEFLLELNKRYLNKNHYTDIITFGYSDNINDKISGDVYISIERVHKNAMEFGQEFEKELLRVISHGILHLLGYDDTTNELKKEMKKKEDLYIDQF